MGSIVSSALLTATTLLAAGGGHGEHEAHFSAMHYLLAVANFVLLFGFLAYKLRPGVRTFLKERREGLAAQLRDARAKQAEADKRMAEYAHKLDHLEEEVARIVKSFEEQGASERERFRQDADRAIERLVREVDFTIKQESLKAQKAIRGAAVQSTLDLAETLVKDRITESDKRRLADEYIGQLDGGSKSKPS